MKFALDISLKAIGRRPFRAVLLALLVMLLSLTVLTGAVIIRSLQNGLSSYRARLGADIVVVPAAATSHGTVDDILLQGITGNYYMSGRDCEKVKAVEGVAAATTQFFLTSAKASCCSTRVQIIGFDPETDFSVQPWIRESYSETLSDGDLIVGANINPPENRVLTFYGQEYRVAAQLARTGTGLDSAVYTNMNTVKQMARSANNLLETSPFQGVDIGSAVSAVLIQAAEGYEISDIADDINIHITKVQASAARNMISEIAAGLGGVSKLIGALIAAVWALAVAVLLAVHALLSNERKKEFAILRVMGASRNLLFRIMWTEAAMTSACGALLGIAVALLVLVPLSSTLQHALGLPFLMPGAGRIAVLSAGALLLTMLAGILAALLSAHRITNNETGLLIREEM